MKSKLIRPSGVCWCNCGLAPRVGAFFMSGHDKRIQGQIIKEVFGGVAEFVAAFGYAPTDEFSQLTVKQLMNPLAQVATITTLRARLQAVLGVSEAAQRLLDVMEVGHVEGAEDHSKG